MTAPDHAGAVLRRLRRRVAVAAGLGVGYLVATRGRVRQLGAPGPSWGGRRGAGLRVRQRAGGGMRRGAGGGVRWDAGIAFVGPLLALGRRAAQDRARWQPPPSLAGRLILGGYLLSGALVEELLWRAPLTVARRAAPRAGLALVSAAGFLALHVRRDGPSSTWPHLLTTASWTGSALVGRRVRWAVLSHALYNYAALSLREAGADAPGPAGR